MEQIIITKPDTTTWALMTRSAVTAVTRGEQKRALLGEDVINMTVESAIPLSFDIGDTINIFGSAYILNALPKLLKAGKRKFSYDITWEGRQYDLLKPIYLDEGVDGISISPDFPLTGNLEFFLDVLINNANRIFGTGVWVLGDCPVTDYLTLNFSNENCLAVLQRLCKQENFGKEFEIIENAGVCTINIKDAIGQNHATTYEYGKGKGLWDLTRETVSDKNIITRLYTFGANKNLASDYRGYSQRLKLPGNDLSYIEDAGAIAVYGLIEGVKIFDEIFPHRTGTVSSPGATVDEFYDTSMNFDLNAVDGEGNTLYLIAGMTAKIHFNTGNLAGYEFGILSYDNGTKKFKIQTFKDERGLEFPNADSSAFQITAGDNYVIIDIRMPQTYIDTAEAALATAGNDYYALVSQPRVQYSQTFDELYFKQKYAGQSTVNVFGIGDNVHINDTDIGVDKTIRLRSFRRDIIRPYKYVLDLYDYSEESIAQRLISSSNETTKIISSNNLNGVSGSRHDDKYYTGAEINTALALKAPKASPSFTGNVTMPGTGIWNSSGEVSIGTTDPAGYKLNVNGTINGTSLYIDGQIDIKKAAYVIATGAAGWVRLASMYNWSYGTISISNNYSNDINSPVIFNFGAKYRSPGNITQIGGTGALFSKARIVYPTATDDPYYIEVYCNGTLGNTYFISLTNAGYVTLYGSYTAGSVPAGYSSNELPFIVGVSAQNINTPGVITATGTITGAKVISTGNLGFQNDLYAANVPNPIWAFGNAASYGMAYYQGSALPSGNAIGFHFGDIAAPKVIINEGGNITATGNITASGSLISETVQSSTAFTTGFAGNGYKIIETGGVSSFEVDSLRVRGSLFAYELEINKISSVNGGFLISVANGTTYSKTGTNYYFDTNNLANPIQFKVGDYVKAQNWTGVSGEVITVWRGVVTAVVQGSGVLGTAYITATTISGTAWDKMDLVQTGGSDPARQSLIYMTAHDTNNPYIEGHAGVTDGTLSDATRKFRLGNLTGITDATLSPSGYGLYSQNVFLSGKIIATSGSFSGVVTIGTTAVNGSNCTIIGSSLNDTSATLDDGTIYINNTSAGSGYYRNFIVGDGKTWPNGILIYADGSAGRVGIRCNSFSDIDSEFRVMTRNGAGLKINYNESGTNYLYGLLTSDSGIVTSGGLHVGGTSDPGVDNLLVDGLTTTIGGMHIGGTSDPGADNLLVDGTIKVIGAFGCNGATPQTKVNAGGLIGTSNGTAGWSTAAEKDKWENIIYWMYTALINNGIMS